jgi:cysteine desulfurase
MSSPARTIRVQRLFGENPSEKYSRRAMQTPVYLDYNATTPVAEAARERMKPYLRERFGNPSSGGHAFGWMAEEAVELARGEVASLLDVEEEPAEALTFTSGATEALNLAIKGVARAYRSKGRHLVTCQTEHKAVLGTCEALEERGWDVTYLPVGADGRVDPARFANALTDETVLATVMRANNETGVLQPVEALAETARAAGVLFLTDATQAVGKIPFDASAVDLAVASAHKFYGPKGAGVLYRRRRRRPRVRLEPLIHGGGQEEGLRGGTLNAPALAGMGAAAALAEEHRDAERLGRLRDRFEEHLRGALPGVQINGAGTERLPQTASVTFGGVRAEHLESELRGLAVSTGSACSTGTQAPSHVLKAMGLSDAEARATLRFSLGRPTTEEEIQFAAERVTEAVRELRNAPVAA